MRALCIAAVVWFLVGGTAVAAGAAGQAPVGIVAALRPAVIPASAGRPMKVPEPTYRWHAMTVPVGACGAVVNGRTMVLPCGDKRVVAYRRRRAEERAAARRWAAERDLTAVLVIAGGAAYATWRRRARRGV